MDKDFLIQLTNNLYRLTLLFPKKEPLRYKMREIADDILAKPNEKDLEILNSFFEVAKSQTWVRNTDILAIQKEYDNLKEELKKAKPPAGGEKKKTNPGEIPMVEAEPRPLLPRPLLPQVMVERQEKILAYLKENGRVQVWQAKQLFPEVSKRTLRRDFEQMLRQEKIERIGERNDTFYQIKNIES